MKRPVGRPRKAQAVRRQQISVHLPQTMVSELDNRLSWSQSRSKFIESAIKEKLNGDFDFTSITNLQLLGMLFSREIINFDLFTSLKKQVEEIEERQ